MFCMYIYAVLEFTDLTLAIATTVLPYSCSSLVLPPVAVTNCSLRSNKERLHRIPQFSITTYPPWIITEEGEDLMVRLVQETPRDVT